MSVPPNPPQQPPWSGEPPYSPPQPSGPMPLSPEDERTWAIVAHVAPPALALVSMGTLGFLTPLIVWLVFRDRSQFVGDQAKEALNFQITLLIGYLIGLVLILAVIGIFILIAVWVLSIVFGIQAAVAVNRHEPYRYPVNIRFIK